MMFKRIAQLVLVICVLTSVPANAAVTLTDVTITEVYVSFFGTPIVTVKTTGGQGNCLESEVSFSQVGLPSLTADDQKRQIDRILSAALAAKMSGSPVIIGGNQCNDVWTIRIK
jgi:hypothetical protein